MKEENIFKNINELTLFIENINDTKIFLIKQTLIVDVRFQNVDKWIKINNISIINVNNSSKNKPN